MLHTHHTHNTQHTGVHRVGLNRRLMLGLLLVAMWLGGIVAISYYYSHRDFEARRRMARDAQAQRREQEREAQRQRQEIQDEQMMEEPGDF